MVAIGQRIGNYRVLRKLGQGGMGAVFEAVQEEIGRRAAIKVLLQDFGTDQSSVQRFINEARAVNIIQHPGLVGIFESGRLDDGAAYFIMDYLDGELLGARLQRPGAFSQALAINLGRQIASALAAAHQKGIVHRDLKPDNIMIVADPEIVGGERIKVFDFGLAKLRPTSPMPQAMSPAAFRTDQGMLLGTPTHMSPEQCRSAPEIDGKADVYALGVILFEMLIGHPPFISNSVAELISMHLRDSPPSLRKLDKAIPVPLSDLVASMLKKEPAERPDMTQVVRQLEELGANRTASTPSTVAKSSAVAELEVAKTQVAENPLPGQPHPTPSITGKRRVALGIGLFGALIIAAFIALRIASPRRTPVHDIPTVTWMIDSDPTGAEIVRADDGEVLGRTPWHRSEHASEDLLRIHLRLAGYRESGVIINRAQNTNQKVSLEPLPKPEAPAPITAGADTKTMKRMRWIVASQPTGAEVILADDNQVVGKTPWTLEQGAGNGILKLYLQLPGYARSSVLLDLTAGTQQTILLQRIGAAPKPAKPASSSTRPPAQRTTTPFSPVY